MKSWGSPHQLPTDCTSPMPEILWSKGPTTLKVTGMLLWCEISYCIISNLAAQMVAGGARLGRKGHLCLGQGCAHSHKWPAVLTWGGLTSPLHDGINQSQHLHLPALNYRVSLRLCALPQSEKREENGDRFLGGTGRKRGWCMRSPGTRPTADTSYHQEVVLGPER